MKTLNTILALFFCATVFAQTSHTVSNVAGNPAQFTVIQDAITAASDGDTIYVAGSAT